MDLSCLFNEKKKKILEGLLKLPFMILRPVYQSYCLQETQELHQNLASQMDPVFPGPLRALLRQILALQANSAQSFFQLTANPPPSRGPRIRVEYLRPGSFLSETCLTMQRIVKGNFRS